MLTPINAQETKAMLVFTLPQMTCGGCTHAVTRVIQQLDPQAQIDINLDTKQAKVTTTLDQTTLRKALTEAGFPPAESTS